MPRFIHGSPDHYYSLEERGLNPTQPNPTHEWSGFGVGFETPNPDHGNGVDVGQFLGFFTNPHRSDEYSLTSLTPLTSLTSLTPSTLLIDHLTDHLADHLAVHLADHLADHLAVHSADHLTYHLANRPAKSTK